MQDDNAGAGWRKLLSCSGEAALKRTARVRGCIVLRFDFDRYLRSLIGNEQIEVFAATCLVGSTKRTSLSLICKRWAVRNSAVAPTSVRDRSSCVMARNP